MSNVELMNAYVAQLEQGFKESKLKEILLLANISTLQQQVVANTAEIERLQQATKDGPAQPEKSITD